MHGVFLENELANTRRLYRETLEICLYKISIGDAILGGLEFMSVSLDRLKKFITVPVLLNNFRQKRNSN